MRSSRGYVNAMVGKVVIMEKKNEKNYVKYEREKKMNEKRGK
jgi:hypothetical protein